ncbi:MAG: class I SAM-dependent methyltransferase [Myxococcaceae bacterium]|nr:class I SAM-dependent methyltransferase [Myxococcaceae bacterium]
MTATTPFFGEVYLRTTRPYLSAVQTERECAYLRQALNALPVGGPVLDLGCGHGRHLGPLGKQTSRRLIGIDGDQLSLQEARPQGAVARGDFFALPFRDEHFAGVFAWYSALFTFDDSAQLPLFREIARVLKPSGRLLFQHVPLLHAQQRGPALHVDTFADGCRVSDQVHYDSVRMRDIGVRSLAEPSGRVLKATYEIRYYAEAELEELLTRAGMRVLFVQGGSDKGALSQQSVELIVGAERE